MSVLKQVIGRHDARAWVAIKQSKECDNVGEKKRAMRSQVDGKRRKAKKVSMPVKRATFEVASRTGKEEDSGDMSSGS